MSTPDTEAQRRRVVRQFTQQAAGYTALPAHARASEFDLVASTAGLAATDTLLDVACGSGLLTLALAPRVAHTVGIDLTPAMLEQARRLQAERGVTNVEWRLGDVLPLPFPDAAFTAVASRYGFHHFPDPRAVLAEMVRVCAPGGVVAVIDVVLPPEKRDAYDRMERLRDPSHERALTPDELRGLFTAHGLGEPRAARYAVEMELERQLAASATAPEAAEQLRRLLRDDVGRDALGVGAQLRGGEVHYAYPIGVLAGRRPPGRGAPPATGSASSSS